MRLHLLAVLLACGTLAIAEPITVTFSGHLTYIGGIPQIPQGASFTAVLSYDTTDLLQKGTDMSVPTFVDSLSQAGEGFLMTVGGYTISELGPSSLNLYGNLEHGSSITNPNGFVADEFGVSDSPPPSTAGVSSIPGLTPTWIGLNVVGAENNLAPGATDFPVTDFDWGVLGSHIDFTGLLIDFSSTDYNAPPRIVGQIDAISVQSVPEPGPFSLLVLAAGMTGAFVAVIRTVRTQCALRMWNLFGHRVGISPTE